MQPCFFNLLSSETKLPENIGVFHFHFQRKWYFFKYDLEYAFPNCLDDASHHQKEYDLSSVRNHLNNRHILYRHTFIINNAKHENVSLILLVVKPNFHRIADTFTFTLKKEILF